MTKTGVDCLGDVPWGTHVCAFYESRDDLAELLVPYFRTGLENNERCVWVASRPSDAEDARISLGGAVGNLDDYLGKGQIEILDHTEWYTRPGTFNADEVLRTWEKAENQAMERGFKGLRVAGDTSWLEEKDWEGFVQYEAAVDKVIGDGRMIALCSYSLDTCGAGEILDVVGNHQSALVRRNERWKLVESAERKRAELQRERLLQADKMITLGTMASEVAHEINNPNNFIMLNVPVIKQIYEAAAPEFERRFREQGDFTLGNMPYSKIRQKMPRLLEAILDGSRRIKRITEDLKDFARYEKAGFEERKDIGDIVESAVSLMGSMIEKATTRFAVEKEGRIPKLYCSAQRLEQVIVNLLQNACQALPDATKGIEVSMRYIEDKHAVQVTVRDEGVGMSEEALAHIRDAFFTTRGDSGGIGLGLSVSERIVKEHGGTLDFESGEGRGTTAVLTLPAGRARGAEGDDPQ